MAAAAVIHLDRGPLGRNITFLIDLIDFYRVFGEEEGLLIRIFFL